VSLMNNDFASLANGGVQIIDSDSDEIADETGLNPCPNCGKTPSDSPMGIHDFHSARKYGSTAGEAKWGHNYCWKCGYRPGVDAVVDAKKMQKQFEAFKAYVNAHNDQVLNHPTTNAALAESNPDYQQVLAQMRAEIDELKGAKAAPAEPTDAA
jgi:hypothetical protein